jgi:hypothetical protein
MNNEKILKAVDLAIDDAFEAGQENVLENAITFEELEKFISKMTEDICPSCPLNADRYYHFESHRTVCDATDWRTRCGIAELRNELDSRLIP